MSGEVWHRMNKSGVAICQADYVNMAKTMVLARVTCAACLRVTLSMTCGRCGRPLGEHVPPDTEGVQCPGKRSVDESRSAKAVPSCPHGKRMPLTCSECRGIAEPVQRPAGSPFEIREEGDGVFRVYVYHVGLYPTGSREDGERLLRSLEHERAETNKAANAELDELRALLRRAVELFGGDVPRTETESPWRDLLIELVAECIGDERNESCIVCGSHHDEDHVEYDGDPSCIVSRVLQAERSAPEKGDAP